MQQAPCAGGKLSQGVDGAEAERGTVGSVVGGDDRVPNRVLLRRVQQKL